MGKNSELTLELLDADTPFVGARADGGGGPLPDDAYASFDDIELDTPLPLPPRMQMNIAIREGLLDLVPGAREAGYTDQSVLAMFEVQSVRPGPPDFPGPGDVKDMEGRLRPILIKDKDDPEGERYSPFVLWARNREKLKAILKNRGKKWDDPRPARLRFWLKRKILKTYLVKLFNMEKGVQPWREGEWEDRKAKMRWWNSAAGEAWINAVIKILIKEESQTMPQGDTVGVDLLWLMYRFVGCEKSPSDMVAWVAEWGGPTLADPGDVMPLPEHPYRPGPMPPGMEEELRKLRAALGDAGRDSDVLKWAQRFVRSYFRRLYRMLPPGPKLKSASDYATKELRWIASKMQSLRRVPKNKWYPARDVHRLILAAKKAKKVAEITEQLAWIFEDYVSCTFGVQELRRHIARLGAQVGI